METEELTLEEKCEQLMTVVVETRKRFGKKCVDYLHRKSRVENQLLELKLEMYSNYDSKRKHPVVDFDVDDFQNVENMKSEILEGQQRIENLCTRLDNTQQVLFQLKNDNIAKKLYQPVSIESLMERAKNKNHPVKSECRKIEKQDDDDFIMS